MKDLGQIEFLREHPMILDRLKELSVNGTLDAFVLDEYAIKNKGGFNWTESKEGNNFWGIIFLDKKPDHFYTLYPKTVKQDTALRDEIAMRAMQGLCSFTGTQGIFNIESVCSRAYQISEAMLIERLK